MSLGINQKGRAMKATDLTACILAICSWASGWVLAKGFWSTLFSVIFPPWGWYLIAERLLS